MSGKLFIICGHGAGDPGACAGGQTEAALVRKLAARIKELGGSDVQIGDMSLNWYETNGIGKGQCPEGAMVLELHMDSAAPSARGGHVVIKKGLASDAFDKALASFIGEFFPGRASTIVGHSDLANPNRAASAGVNYRLLECGFISNGGDRAKFMNQMDDLARGILQAAGIGSSTPAPEKPATPSTPGKLYRVQLGAFSIKANADKFAAELRLKGYKPIITHY